MSKRITLEEWKERIKFMNPNMEIINLIQPKGTKEDPYICHCNDCGATFTETLNKIKASYQNYKTNGYKNKWCPVCNGKRCITNINDVTTLRPDLIDYFVDINDAKKHTIGSKFKPQLKCPYCGYKKVMAIYQLSGQGFNCNICSDSLSFPNKICRNLILQLPVDEYDFEYNANWTQGKQYDCYFMYHNYKYLLEFDGEQHYKDTEWTTKQWQIENDKKKDILAYNNGFKLIRIDCYKSDFNYIKNNILHSELNNIFDLENIDWTLIYNKSLSNFYFDVGNYYTNNTDKSLTDIAKYFHITHRTLLNILNKLTEIGMCNYSKEKSQDNVKEFISKSKVKNKELFYIYDPNNNIIGRFKSPRLCCDYLNNNISNINITESMLRYYLFTGANFKGYRFVYEIGLNEYHKNNDYLFKVCKLYNQMKDQQEISKITNRCIGTVTKYLITGNNIGLCEYPRNKNKEAA